MSAEMELDRLVAYLDGDSTGFQKMLAAADSSMKATVEQVKQAGGQIGEVVNHLRGFASAAVGAFAAFGISRGLKEAFTAYGQFEQTAVRLNSAIKSNGGEVDATLADYDRFADTVWRSANVSKTMTQRLLEQAEAHGMTGDAAKKAVTNAIAISGINQQSPLSNMRAAEMLEQGNYRAVSRSLRIAPNTPESELREKILAALKRGLENQSQVMDTSLGSVERLQSTFSSLSRTIGEMVADFIRPAVDWLQRMADAFQSLDPETKKVVAQVAMVGLALASIGPILAVLGPVMTIVLSPVKLVLSTLSYLIFGVIGGLLQLSAVLLVSTGWVIFKAAVIGVNVVIGMFSVATVAWNAILYVLIGTVHLTAIALGVLQASFTVLGVLNFVIGVGLLVPLLVTVSAAAYGAYKAFTSLVESVSALANGAPMEAVTGLFGEWWGMLKNVVEAFKADIPFGIEYTKAVFSLMVSQVTDLFPPLWTFLKAGFNEVALIVTARFNNEFDRLIDNFVAKAEIAHMKVFTLGMGSAKYMQERLDELNKNRDKFNDTLSKLGAKGIDRIMDEFSLTDSDKTRDLKKALDEMTEKLLDPEKLKKWKDEQEKLKIDENLTDPLKRATHEAHKFDAALVGSVEAVARMAAYEDRFLPHGGGGKTLTEEFGVDAGASGRPGSGTFSLPKAEDLLTQILQTLQGRLWIAGASDVESMTFGE